MSPRTDASTTPQGPNRIRIWLAALGLGHAIAAASLAAQAGATLPAVLIVAVGALALTLLVAVVVSSRRQQLSDVFDWDTFEQSFRAYAGKQSQLG